MGALFSLEGDRRMRSIMLVLAGVATTAMFMAAQGVQAQIYPLPQDPAEPVITLDYQGDRLRCIDPAPTLSILADGRVVMPQSYAHTQAYEDQISDAELQELLDFIIRENQFFDYEEETVEAKLSTLERQPLPIHLSTTVILVNADNQTKEVRCPALGHGPMVEETTRLLAVKQRLDQLMSVAKLGGKVEVASWLGLANRELSSKYPDATPLISEDLESGARRADGSIHARFVRRDDAETTSVTIDITADGERYLTTAQEDL